MRAGASAIPEPPDRGITVEHPPVRRRLFGRRNNRRITVARPSMTAWLAGPLRAVATKLALLGKALLVVTFVAGAMYAGRQLVRHVIASPRFAVRDIQIGPSARVSGDEIRELLGVHLGDRLLAVDPDAVAARLTTHPWILSARVRRELPSTLAVEVTERRAVASALLGALYLLDDAGRPFKRATFAEADGLPVITGVTRDQYASVRGTSEAVFRQALALYTAYSNGHPERPKLSEIHVDTRTGFSLVLFEGSGELRLGRGDFDAKLAHFDRVFAALGPRSPAALQTIYLDGPLSDRVAIRMATNPAAEPPPDRTVVASEKPRPAVKHAKPPAEPAAPAGEPRPAADED
jgi:cell division septal protein FtsQ